MEHKKQQTIFNQQVIIAIPWENNSTGRNGQTQPE